MAASLGARQLANRVVDNLQRAGNKDGAAAYEVQAALREALVGNTGTAKTMANEALGLRNSVMYKPLPQSFWHLPAIQQRQWSRPTALHNDFRQIPASKITICR